MRIKF